MSQKPVDQRTTLDTRETLWTEIRRVRTFTISDLQHVTRMQRNSIRAYVTGLLNGNYLEISGEIPTTSPGGAKPTKQYSLIKDVGIIAPRVRKNGQQVIQGHSRQLIWNTMRVLTTFSAADLAITASVDDCQVSETEVKAYAGFLCKAKYLVVVAAGKPGKPATYRLVKNTGPRPPQIQRIKNVYDPNIKQIVWSSQEQSI